jgi:hypothetical protein
MADNVQPDAGEQREDSSSGLLLSVDPLQGANNYKLAGDDSGSDKGGLLGDDASDSDGSDSEALEGDDSDASDSDGTDKSESDDSDADGTDAEDADGTDTGLDADGTDPLGIAPGDMGAGGKSGAAPPPDNDGTDSR